MRLLSDFDGVWTDPLREGVAQGTLLEKTVREWAAADGRAGVDAWFAAAQREAAEAPTRYGWLSDGRLSAFADEDPFVLHSALLHVLHSRVGMDALADWYVARVRQAGHDGLDVFGGVMHYAAVAQVEAERGPAILSDAVAAGQRMLATGVDIVVVSNSVSAKLERWFGAAGMRYTLDPERASGALRLRGGARKFVLDGASQRLRLGGLDFEVGRPHYRAVFDAERPDAVVGDVFSLDLALPLWLRRHVSGFERLRLFWLKRSYTPRWLLDVVAAEAPEVELLDDGLGGVAERSLAAPR